MRHLVGNHRLDFFLIHAVQQARGYRHQRIIARWPRGKGIGLALINGHLRHGNASTLGMAGNGVHQPGFGLVARLVDDLGASRPLGHHFRHEQRNKSATKAHHHGQPQQRAQAAMAAKAQQAGHQAEHQHYRQVGGKK